MSKLRLENVVRIARNPSLIRGEVNHQATQLNAAIHRRIRGTSGPFVVDEEWDNLLILDGCRYDMFAEHSTLPGRLRRVTSRGSQSLEYLEEQFVGRELHDTVYVSANPYTTRLPEDTFHAVIELYTDGWDDEYETVLPETVVEATIEAAERFPDKRYVVHFMQPHIPFIGEKGRTLSHTGLAHEDIDIADDPDEKRYPVWSNLRYGFTDITEEEVWEAYVENLEVVLPYVEDLLEQSTGRR